MRFAERLHMKLSVGEKGKQFKFFPSTYNRISYLLSIFPLYIFPCSAFCIKVPQETLHFSHNIRWWKIQDARESKNKKHLGC
jgi:hypothetical protein